MVYIEQDTQVDITTPTIRNAAFEAIKSITLPAQITDNDIERYLAWVNS